MKIVSAHQPAYMPWLGYFHKMLLCDEFVVMDDVQYEKNSFINRNKILLNTSSVWLTVPVATKDYKTRTIRDMKVVDHKWKRKHVASIEQSYRKAPHFDAVMPIVAQTLNQDSDFLIDYTNAFLTGVISYLDIATTIHWASEMDIRSKKLDYVIELTGKLEGSVFVFGELGKDYADESVLEAAGIRPYFQAYDHPEYRQNANEFVPYLGVVDALFFCGKETLDLISVGNMTIDTLRSNISTP